MFLSSAGILVPQVHFCSIKVSKLCCRASAGLSQGCVSHICRVIPQFMLVMKFALLLSSLSSLCMKHHQVLSCYFVFRLFSKVGTSLTETGWAARASMVRMFELAKKIWPTIPEPKH